jgi:hypothetical protein
MLVWLPHADARITRSDDACRRGIASAYADVFEDCRDWRLRLVDGDAHGAGDGCRGPLQQHVAPRNASVAVATTDA